jgi:hypothetical protein
MRQKSDVKPRPKDRNGKYPLHSIRIHADLHELLTRRASDKESSIVDEVRDLIKGGLVHEHAEHLGAIPDTIITQERDRLRKEQ